MADNRRHRTNTIRCHQANRIARQIQHTEGCQIAVVIGVPASGVAIAALVRGDHVVAGCRQREKNLAPAIGKLRKTMQQQQAGTARLAGFQHMHGEAVDAGNLPGADACWQLRFGNHQPTPTAPRAARAAISPSV